MESDLSNLIFVVALGWLLASIAVGATAYNRNRSGFLWLLLAIFVSPLMAILLLIASPIDTQKRVSCQRCAEFIHYDAKVCPFCGVDRKEEPQKTVDHAFGAPLN